MALSTIIVQTPDLCGGEELVSILEHAGARPGGWSALSLGYQTVVTARCKPAPGSEERLLHRIAAAAGARPTILPAVAGPVAPPLRLGLRGTASDSPGHLARILAAVRDAGAFPSDVHVYRVGSGRLLLKAEVSVRPGRENRLTGSLREWLAPDGASVCALPNFRPLVSGTRTPPAVAGAGPGDVIGRKALTVVGPDPADVALRTGMFLNEYGATIEREHGQTAGGLFVLSVVFTVPGIAAMLDLAGTCPIQLAKFHPRLGPTHWRDVTDQSTTSGTVSVGEARGAGALVLITEAAARSGVSVGGFAFSTVGSGAPGWVSAGVRVPTGAEVNFRERLKRYCGSRPWKLTFATGAAQPVSGPDVIPPRSLRRSRAGELSA